MEVAATEPARRQLSPRTLTILLAVLSAAIVALAVVAVLLGFKLSKVQGEAAQTQFVQSAGATTAAKQAGVNLATMDYRHAGADVQRLMSGLTGAAKTEMEKTGRQQVVAQLGKVKTWSVGQVLDAGVVSSDADSAQVLVVVDQTVRSADVPNGVVHHLRWQMTVNRVGGRWLVSKLEPTE